MVVKQLETGRCRFIRQAKLVQCLQKKPEVYRKAYKAVKSNAGSAGVDGQTIEQFDSDLPGAISTKLFGTE